MTVGAVQIQPLGRDPGSIAQWDRYVLDSPVCSGYHLTAWRDIVERAFGHDTVYLMAQDSQGDVRGILPMVAFASRLFGRFLVSMPFVNYGGLVANSQEAQAALLDAAVQEACRRQVRHVELRQQASLPLDWPCKTHKVSMRLELPQDFEILMKQFPSKLRSQIKRPQKEGMTASVGGIDLFDDFYVVFSRNMRDLGTPVYSPGFFQCILESLPKDTALAVVRWNQQPVAAGFVYQFRGTMEIPWASADRRFDRWSPNMLLYSTVLEYACRQGCRAFDFGRSSPDSGTYRFKAQWGAQPVPLYWYYWLKDGGPLPELNPNNPKYQLAIAAWRRLPLGVANLLGPQIVKHLP